MRIRELFNPDKDLNRRIEKVITYDSIDPERLRPEITEYEATESIESSFERLLDLLEEGMSGDGGHEIGVWVSGFYGSGKSSFTKYLGFSLDPGRTLDGKPFLEWLQNRFTSKSLRARLAVVASRHPATVVMLDLATEQLAGASMLEISSVLYSKVMQWAGYSRDRKVAYLEYMLERDGKMAQFEARISELARGKTWKEIHDLPLVVKAFASQLAAEFYPDIWPDSRSFNEITVDEAEKEDDRVREMIEIIRRRSGKQNIIFILDEVGQYIAARDSLILNLDGFAKNIKNIGKGRVWILATAQQTLTEDDPRAHMNRAGLFKLKDRFPVPIDLEASDIRQICTRRLLGKSKAGEEVLAKLFESRGHALRHAVQLANTRYYKSDLDRKTFCNLYPFLPQHFDILLELLSRLAKTSGGIGLRSAIKVVQDVLVDQSGVRPGETLLADQDVGTLATTVVLYDTLRRDIQRSFRHIVEGVEKVQTAFGADSVHARAAKSVAVLQVLDDFPVSRENLAALMHPSAESPSLLPQVKEAVEDLLGEPAIPLNEVDGSLRFMSEAVTVLENERRNIIPRNIDLQNIRNAVLRTIFTPLPSSLLLGTRTVNSGVKIADGGLTISLLGDKEEIQTVLEFVAESRYEAKRGELLLESQQRANRNNIFLTGIDDPDVQDLMIEIHRCRTIYNDNRNKRGEKEITDYLTGQLQRAEKLTNDLGDKFVKALFRGSFIFRGKPKPVSELKPDLKEAAKKFIKDVAEEVFEKYCEAPVQVESAVAERFLRTEQLDRIASKDDPLSLVRKSGKRVGIDSDHKALVSIKDYLDLHGHTDGKKLLDDFHASPYGWSRDTTRYLVAALLTGGEVKLRVGGQDVTVRGRSAIESTKNTNSFNKIGISLRSGGKPSPESLLRASDRLLELTGDTVLPLEEDISKIVRKHFPDLQQDFAPLAIQLKALGLPGADNAQSVQDSISEILKGDASDATNRLGCDPCPLYENLAWARKVKKAFDNGIEPIIGKVNHYLTGIPALPETGIPAVLMDHTATTRTGLRELIGRNDFFDAIPELQTQLGDLESKVAEAVSALTEEEEKWLEEERKRIRGLREWGQLPEEDRVACGSRLDRLGINAATDLLGMQKLINDHYTLMQELRCIEQDVISIAQRDIVIINNPENDLEPLDVDLSVPVLLRSRQEIDAIILELEALKSKLESYSTIKVNWRLPEDNSGGLSSSR